MKLLKATFLFISFSLMTYNFSFGQKLRKDTFMLKIFSFDTPSPSGWNQPYTGTITFPSIKGDWAKIYLIQKIKCDPRTNADTFPCGEWDYYTHTVLIDSLDEEFEIAGFITPYGKRLDLGPNGKEFTYDITDYSPILKGKWKIKSGNNQELLDLTFVFIRGTPPRKCLKVSNLYPTGLYKYQDIADDSSLKKINLKLLTESKYSVIKSRISGHGHFGPYNCCEWVAKKHTWTINNEEKFHWTVWKDCGQNPIFPQGGTWQFDRAGWCPGTEIVQNSFEIGDFCEAGDTIQLDYGIEPYNQNGEKEGEFRICHQLFEFADYISELDADLVDIVNPSVQTQNARFNPNCCNPILKIKNVGKTTIQSLQIEYGYKGERPKSYDWYGKIPTSQDDLIYLPPLSLPKRKKQIEFESKIIMINGAKDDNPANNQKKSPMVFPEKLPNVFNIYIETNDQGRAHESGYYILNQQGKKIVERASFEDDAIYTDRISLQPGCYTLHFFDRKQDGLVKHWWLRNEAPEKVGKNGKIELQTTEGKLIKNLPYDYADMQCFSFIVEK